MPSWLPDVAGQTGRVFFRLLGGGCPVWRDVGDGNIAPVDGVEFWRYHNLGFCCDFLAISDAQRVGNHQPRRSPGVAPCFSSCREDGGGWHQRDDEKAARGLGGNLFSNPGWWFGTFSIFPYIGNNHPNWLIFFRGVQTTNQQIIWCRRSVMRWVILCYTVLKDLLSIIANPRVFHVGTLTIDHRNVDWSPHRQSSFCENRSFIVKISIFAGYSCFAVGRFRWSKSSFCLG